MSSDKRKWVELAVAIIGMYVFVMLQVPHKGRYTSNHMMFHEAMSWASMFYFLGCLWWFNRRFVKKPENIRRGKKAVLIFMIFISFLLIIRLITELILFLRRS